MDARGWIPIPALILAVQKKMPKFRFLRPHHLYAIAQTDDKGRYEVRENNIRATYGHTIQVELDLPTNDIPDQLFYPVQPAELENATARGIEPVEQDPLILEVDAKRMRADGHVIMRAGTVVFLADKVPGEYLKKIEVDVSEAIAKSRKEREEAKARKNAPPPGPGESGAPGGGGAEGGDGQGPRPGGFGGYGGGPGRGPRDDYR